MGKKEHTASEKKFLKKIGDAIRVYRLKNDISQEELAYQSSLDRAYVGRVERGEKNISVLSLRKISNALKVDIVKLINQ